MKIEFQGKNLVFQADLIENPAAQEIGKHLPLKMSARTWGDEIYMETGIVAPSDGATLDVYAGDIAYWPEGKCLCVFFGPTVLSTDAKPVPASPVVIIGKTYALSNELRQIRDNDEITVVKASSGPDVSAQSERKLSQSEIDELVKRLLEEKKRQSH